MTIKKKILLGFFLVAAIGIITGIVGLAVSTKLTGMSKNLSATHEENVHISEVLNAHYVWRQGLTETVLTGAAFTGSLDPATCAFGSWYNSESAKNITDPEILTMLSKVYEPHNLIHREAQTIVNDMQTGDVEDARAHLLNIVLPTTQEVTSLFTSMEHRYAVVIDELSQETERYGTKMNVVIVILIAIAAVMSAILAMYISRSIVKPLIPLAGFMTKASTTGDISLSPEDEEVIRQLSQVKDEIGQTITSCAGFVGRITQISQVLETIAGGDMTAELFALSELDVIGNSMEKMSEKLNDMFSEINLSAEQVSAGSKQVADGAQALAQGATEQAASIEELSSSISQLADKTKQNAELAEKADSLAGLIKANAEKGSKQMDEMMAAVNEINEASGSINKVIKVIDDIAFQTNILALNAAVEAARAGEAGKGFAVVAEEVRNLAAKSAAAAKDTGSLIENSIEKANLGVQIASDTAASLAEIVAGINESSHIVDEIAKASELQSTEIRQINVGIDQVAQVVQTNSATAQESAAASEEMSSQSAMLKEYISQFHLKHKEDIYSMADPRGSASLYATAIDNDYSYASGIDYNDKY